MFEYIADLLKIGWVILTFGFLPGLAVGALYHEHLLEKGNDK